MNDIKYNEDTIILNENIKIVKHIMILILLIIIFILFISTFKISIYANYIGVVQENNKIKTIIKNTDLEFLKKELFIDKKSCSFIIDEINYINLKESSIVLSIDKQYQTNTVLNIKLFKRKTTLMNEIFIFIKKAFTY